MRTPGYDFDLAAGFLMTEGVVRDVNDIERVVYAGVGNIDESAESSTAQEFSPSQPWIEHRTRGISPGCDSQPGKPAAQLLHYIELRHLRKGVVAGVADRLPSAQEQSVFNQR